MLVSTSSHRSDDHNPPHRGQVSVRAQKDPKAQTSVLAKPLYVLDIERLCKAVHVNVQRVVTRCDKRLVRAADEGQVAWEPGYNEKLTQGVGGGESQQSLILVKLQEPKGVASRLARA